MLAICVHPTILLQKRWIMSVLWRLSGLSFGLTVPVFGHCDVAADCMSVCSQLWLKLVHTGHDSDTFLAIPLSDQKHLNSNQRCRLQQLLTGSRSIARTHTPNWPKASAYTDWPFKPSLIGLHGRYFWHVTACHVMAYWDIFIEQCRH